MPPRKARGHYAPRTSTYDLDDIPRDEVMASMIVRLICQLHKRQNYLSNAIIHQNSKPNQVKTSLTHSLLIDLELSLLMIEIGIWVEN